MKSIPYLITVAALIFAFVMWDRCRDTELLADLKMNQAKTDLNNALESRDSTERANDSIISSERGIRAKVEQEAAKRENSFKATLTRQAGSISQLKALRDTQGIAPDSLSQAIEVTQDSTIQAQAWEIDSLHLDIDKMKVSFQTEIDAVTDKLEAEREVSSNALAVIDGLESELKREKKRGRVFKYLALGLAGWLIFDEIKD